MPDPLEGHPLSEDRWPDLERLFGRSGAYLGTVSMFAAHGFREVARRTPKRPIFRLTL
jgi:hypothetical protein